MDTDYVKTLLYSYPKIEEMAQAVGCGAENKAALSYRGVEDALKAAERVAEEIVMSKKLYLLKEKIDKALLGLSEKEAFLLEYKYFRRKEYLKGKYLGFVLNCSQRSYFRMQNALLSKISLRLFAAGLSKEKFLNDFKDFPPFMRVLGALQSGKDRLVYFNRRRRGVRFQNSKDSCEGAGFLPRSKKSAIERRETPAAQRMAICTPESPFFGVGSSTISPEGEER